MGNIANIGVTHPVVKHWVEKEGIQVTITLPIKREQKNLFQEMTIPDGLVTLFSDIYLYETNIFNRKFRRPVERTFLKVTLLVEWQYDMDSVTRHQTYRSLTRLMLAKAHLEKTWWERQVQMLKDGLLMKGDPSMFVHYQEMEDVDDFLPF